MSKKTLFLVSHTHWDREWYLTREEFLMFLVDLVNGLLKLLESDENFKMFMLDGQTIALEDYLSVCPEKKRTLEKYIQDGRILIGPWYVLPDEYLISGEGHIRNYLIGRDKCREFGGQMNVGYLPDSFGHPSQMPQLIKGLGMNEIVFWRGLGPEISETELVWQGLDETEILGINMPFGYGVAACLPEGSAQFLERMKGIINKLAPLTRTNSLLLMQGVDHVAPMKELSSLIKTSQPALADYEIVHGNLQDYLSSLPDDISFQKTSGELRSGYKAYLLGGTISTRIYIKQENFRRETDLIRYAEPLSSIASIFGAQSYQTDTLRHAWKMYLQNMPHDSICGCSVDKVHDEMMLRYRDLNSINTFMQEKSVEALAAVMGRPEGDYDGYLMIFNPETYKQSDVITLSLSFEKKLLRKVNYATGELEESHPVMELTEPSGILIYDHKGTGCPGKIIKSEIVDEMKLSLNTQPEMYQTRKILIEFIGTDAPALGLSVRGYRWCYDKPAEVLEKYEEAVTQIENEYYTVSVCISDTSIVLMDKRNKREIPAFITFGDTGDAGDEYTFSAPSEDAQEQWEIVNLLVDETPISSILTINGYMEIPESLTSDRLSRSEKIVRCELVTTLTLYKGIPRIQISSIFNNLAEDHRLRVLFHTGLAAAESHAEGMFGVDTRAMTCDDGDLYASWIEPPSTHPHKTFVAVNEKEQSFCVANRGLPAYETWNDVAGRTIIALTLLRSVGWLSRNDLQARKGNGGWTIPTPGAQCPGWQTFEFAVFTRLEDMDYSNISSDAHTYAYPMKAWQIPSNSKNRNSMMDVSIFEIDNSGIVFSALKKAEADDDFVIRLYNTTGKTQQCSASFHFPLHRVSKVDLQENSAINLPEEKGKGFSLDFSPWEIVTLKIELEK